jgi:hypothetical protein
MSVGEIIFMVAVVVVAVLMAILKDKLPAWAGFLLMIAAGIVAIAGGAATKNYRAVPLGVAAVIGTVILWIAGATSAPSVSDSGDTLGGTASNARWYIWLIVAGLLVGGVGIGFALPR